MSKYRNFDVQLAEDMEGADLKETFIKECDVLDSIDELENNVKDILNEFPSRLGDIKISDIEDFLDRIERKLSALADDLY